jgi:hypothetical protein
VDKGAKPEDIERIKAVMAGRPESASAEPRGKHR